MTMRSPVLPGLRMGAAALALATLAASPAIPQGLDLTSAFNQSFSANSNRGLNDPSDDASFTTRSSISFAASSGTRRTSFRSSGTLGLSRTTGGDSDDEGFEIVAPAVRANLNRAWSRFSLSSGVSLRIDEVDATRVLTVPRDPIDPVDPDQPPDPIDPDDPDLDQPDDLELVRGTGLRIDTGLSLGANYELTALDRLSFGATADRTEFSEDEAGDGSTDFGLSVGWSRPIDNDTRGSLRLTLNMVEAEGEDANSQRANLRAGLSRTLADDQSINGGIGFTLSESEDEDRIDSALSGDLGLSLALTNTERLSVSFRQGVDPDADGELQLNTSLNSSLTRDLTSRDSVTAGLGLTRQADLSEGGETEAILRASLSYSRQITRGTRLTAGYVFRVSDDNGAQDHAVSVGFSVPLLQ